MQNTDTLTTRTLDYNTLQSGDVIAVREETGKNPCLYLITQIVGPDGPDDSCVADLYNQEGIWGVELDLNLLIDFANCHFVDRCFLFDAEEFKAKDIVRYSSYKFLLENPEPSPKAGPHAECIEF